jgi:hypothetical protein
MIVGYFDLIALLCHACVYLTSSNDSRQKFDRICALECLTSEKSIACITQYCTHTYPFVRSAFVSSVLTYEVVMLCFVASG